jgi:hypothetical protein
MNTNVMTEWLFLLFHISEIMDSNLCPQTGYHVDIGVEKRGIQLCGVRLLY